MRNIEITNKENDVIFYIGQPERVGMFLLNINNEYEFVTLMI